MRIHLLFYWVITRNTHSREITRNNLPDKNGNARSGVETCITGDKQFLNYTGIRIYIKVRQPSSLG